MRNSLLRRSAHFTVPAVLVALLQITIAMPGLPAGPIDPPTRTDDSIRGALASLTTAKTYALRPSEPGPIDMTGPDPQNASRERNADQGFGNWWRSASKTTRGWAITGAVAFLLIAAVAIDD